jgi:hypothetical protein
MVKAQRGTHGGLDSLSQVGSGSTIPDSGYARPVRIDEGFAVTQEQENSHVARIGFT